MSQPLVGDLLVTLTNQFEMLQREMP